jgi:hypothetical protein
MTFARPTKEEDRSAKENEIAKERKGKIKKEYFANWMNN